MTEFEAHSVVDEDIETTTELRDGGLDAYLLSTADEKLAPEGLRLKRQVKKALAGSSRRTEAAAAS